MAVATLKHVAAYSLEQWSPDGNWSEKVYDRGSFNAVVSRYDLEDSYTQPFQRAIEHGGAAGVMYACNMVNKVPAVASADLATRLRSWGFTGYRTTDGGGIGHVSSKAQNYTATVEAGINVSLVDGESDIDDGSTYATSLLSAVEAGLDVKYVRRALFNTFRIRFRLGLFDPVPMQRWHGLGMADVDTPEAQALNREAARQSLVLLQNDGGVLPFQVPQSGNVVVIGPSANSTRLLGGGHYARTLPLVDGFETGGFPGIPQAVQAVLDSHHRSRGGVGGGASVRYFPGLNCTPRADSVCKDPKHSNHLKAEAVGAVASESTRQVILVINLQSRAMCTSDQAVKDGGEFNPCGYEAEQFDRSSVSVPLLQRTLARTVLAAAKSARVPVAVVLVHGGALAIEELKADAPAILDAHYPGMATGAQAVADALYGGFSPAGKLPYSVMPSSWPNISNFTSMSLTEPPGRTYRYYPTDATKYPPVVFPFGWGLTYTTFSLRLDPPQPPEVPLPPNGAIQPTVTVENTGAVDSDEVVQVFFAPRFTRQGVPTPIKQLVDFERVHVVAGAVERVSFLINATQLSLVTSNGSRQLFPGLYELIFTNGVNAKATMEVTVA